MVVTHLIDVLVNSGLLKRTDDYSGNSKLVEECMCGKSKLFNLTDEEKKLSNKRYEYAMVTIMNKFKSKEVYRK